jgi:hypothetical protein
MAPQKQEIGALIEFVTPAQLQAKILSLRNQFDLLATSNKDAFVQSEAKAFRSWSETILDSWWTQNIGTAGAMNEITDTWQPRYQDAFTRAQASGGTGLAVTPSSLFAPAFDWKPIYILGGLAVTGAALWFLSPLLGQKKGHKK